MHNFGDYKLVVFTESTPGVVGEGEKSILMPLGCIESTGKIGSDPQSLFHHLLLIT